MLLSFMDYLDYEFVGYIDNDSYSEFSLKILTQISGKNSTLRKTIVSIFYTLTKFSSKLQ